MGYYCMEGKFYIVSGGIGIGLSFDVRIKNIFYNVCLNGLMEGQIMVGGGFFLVRIDYCDFMVCGDQGVG